MALAHPERVGAIIIQNAVSHEQGLSPLWEARRKYWANPSQELDHLKTNFTSLEATRQRPIGSSPNLDRYDPDAGHDEYAFLIRPARPRSRPPCFSTYRTNVASYPQWQNGSTRYSRRPWWYGGNYDPSFTVAGATAYASDVPKAEIHLLDAGHFALDEATDEIGSLVHNFLDRLNKHSG